MRAYLDLADYLLIAEGVLGLPAELVAGFNRIGLAGSERAAPADVPRPPAWARRLQAGGIITHDRRPRRFVTVGQSPVVGPGDWARGLRPVTRSRAVARLAYDRASRWNRVEEPFERRAVAAGLGLLRAQPGERVLELGCGAGGALVTLARAVGGAGRVVGLDLSPGMLRLASARLRRAGLADRAELVVADATAVPFADASFDVVFMSFTLELFDTPEIPLVLAECRRALRPGGRIGVVSLSRAAPVRWPTRLYERLHDRFPATLDCRPIHGRLALEAAGFEPARSKLVPLWGLRAEAVAAVRPAATPQASGLEATAMTTTQPPQASG